MLVPISDIGCLVGCSEIFAQSRALTSPVSGRYRALCPVLSPLYSDTVLSTLCALVSLLLHRALDSLHSQISILSTLCTLDSMYSRLSVVTRPQIPVRLPLLTVWRCASNKWTVGAHLTSVSVGAHLTIVTVGTHCESLHRSVSRDTLP